MKNEEFGIKNRWEQYSVITLIKYKYEKALKLRNLEGIRQNLGGLGYEF